MLKSMTAFGRASLTLPLGRFIVELQSVNRKYLEINTSLPSELSCFDPFIKKIIASEVSRGQVNVKLTVIFAKSSPLVVAPNLPLARQEKAAWDLIAKDLGLKEEKGFSLQMLVDKPDILLYAQETADEAEYQNGISQVIAEALKAFVAMKLAEGAILQRDIEMRLATLKSAIEKIALKAPDAPAKQRQKLKERLEEVLPGCVENEERILREICLYADRLDITEEIIRFRSHLEQCHHFMESNAGIAKTLEFLLQELNREINTIGSKSADVEISHLVVGVKSELERIREQIQNIE